MKKPKTPEDPQPAQAAAQEKGARATATETLHPQGSTPAASAGAMISEDDLEALRTEAAKAKENWDRLLRVTAEFDNFRKRAAREKEEAVRYANHKLLERLLPVLDSFDMAITAANSEEGRSSESLKQGIELVLQQLKSVLTESGLEEIEAHGKPFDPNLHEAISQVETEDFEEGHVAQQVRKGYLLRDRLVRPSSVIVAKKPAE
jgi:molecular chaperone GrpE